MDNIKKTYLAYVLSPSSRERLLKIYPPKFSNVICHHITIDFNINPERLKTFKHLLDWTPEVITYGYACDDSLECLAVKVGQDKYRLDESFYHITLSLEPPRKPVHSNNLRDLIKTTRRSIILDGSFQFLPK